MWTEASFFIEEGPELRLFWCELAFDESGKEVVQENFMIVEKDSDTAETLRKKTSRQERIEFDTYDEMAIHLSSRTCVLVLGDFKDIPLKMTEAMAETVTLISGS